MSDAKINAAITKQVNKLTKRLDIVEKKLLRVSNITNNTKEVSMRFWSRLRKEVRAAYEEARIVYAKWTELNLPAFYNRNIQEQIRRIKGIDFTPPKSVNYRKFIKTGINDKTINKIMRDSIKDYFTGLAKGEKKLNRLLGITQQLNVDEKAIDIAIEKGLKRSKTVLSAKKSLQNRLMKDALDGKYILVIDKNGNPINYHLGTYAELVSRTKIIDSLTAGTINVARAFGSDLIQVSSHNTLTAYDATFEGKIFSLSGKDPDFPAVSDLPSFHVNCQHSTTVVFREVLEDRGIDKYSDFSKGKTFEHPTREGHIPTNRMDLRQKKAEELGIIKVKRRA
jgi:hypothetical protein